MNPPAVIVQADAIGYIFGWFGAVWRDANSARGLRAEDQYTRIGTGLWAGMAASSGRLIKAAFLEPIDPTDDEPEVRV